MNGKKKDAEAESVTDLSKTKEDPIPRNQGSIFFLIVETEMPSWFPILYDGKVEPLQQLV